MMARLVIKSLIITLVLLICGFMTFLSFMNNIYCPWRNSQLKKELKICQNELQVEKFNLILKKLIKKKQEEENEKLKKELEELTTKKRDMTTAIKSYRDIKRQIIEKRFKKEDSVKLKKKLEELATEFERLGMRSV